MTSSFGMGLLLMPPELGMTGLIPRFERRAFDYHPIRKTFM
jgi:hypothetical protein